MPITRRQFLLGTSTGLILPSYYDKVVSYFENHGEPLIIAPKHPKEILYACSEFAANGFELKLGHPEMGPPEMTIREFCLAYGEGNPEKWWRESWLCPDDPESIDMDAQMEPDFVMDWWVRKDSSSALAYRYLEDLDLGPHLAGYKVVGGLNFIDGASPGNDYLGVEAVDEISLSLLQQRLNELGTEIEVRLY
jgi:hypothetical protein